VVIVIIYFIFITIIKIYLVAQSCLLFPICAQSRLICAMNDRWWFTVSVSLENYNLLYLIDNKQYKVWHSCCNSSTFTRWYYSTVLCCMFWPICVNFGPKFNHMIPEPLLIIWVKFSEPSNGHIKTTEQRTVIQQYSDWYILQCYDTVGWVIWRVKSSPKWPIICRVGR